jgi:hypothetical protein
LVIQSPLDSGFAKLPGAALLLIRRGKKNSRIARIDAKRRRTVGESFIVESLRLDKIHGADELWLGWPNADMSLGSQTVRLDSEVAEQLQSFAARNFESISDAVQRLLRSR